MRQTLLTLVILAAFAGSPALASCLSQGEMREAVAAGQAISAVDATRAAQQAYSGGEVTRVELCRAGGGLVYRITVLQRDGRVAQVNVDARSGALR
ncbi:MAG: PepSY domain-containing protein [Salinarimonas sp.]|nr:PepSY domain-containing protein [Salinarimonas sp.]